MKQTDETLNAATFAGGCFWCTEADFEKVDGVVAVISGYAGGHTSNPTYQQVCAGGTGHLEVVQVHYDPQRVSYMKLLDIFWQHVDPTDAGGQFVDRGPQYRSAIFYHDEEQRRLAEESKKKLEQSGRFAGPLKTVILKIDKFYRAEDYHQGYYKKNPQHYQFYRSHSGRDQFLKKIWDLIPKAGSVPTGQAVYTKPADEILSKKLTPLQYQVTRQEGTEPAFDNTYWDNKREGIYVDVVSGEPLFVSLDKYDSGTGWPSFTQSRWPEHIVERQDHRFSMTRTEVRSRYGDSHLGHVFSDGPSPGGLRYCINSAALRFIPKENLEQRGYGEYGKLFTILESERN